MSELFIHLQYVYNYQNYQYQYLVDFLLELYTRKTLSSNFDKSSDFHELFQFLWKTSNFHGKLLIFMVFVFIFARKALKIKSFHENVILRVSSDIYQNYQYQC